MITHNHILNRVVVRTLQNCGVPASAEGIMPFRQSQGENDSTLFCMDAVTPRGLLFRHDDPIKDKSHLIDLTITSSDALPRPAWPAQDGGRAVRAVASRNRTNYLRRFPSIYYDFRWSTLRTVKSARIRTNSSEQWLPGNSTPRTTAAPETNERERQRSGVSKRESAATSFALSTKRSHSARPPRKSLRWT